MQRIRTVLEHAFDEMVAASGSKHGVSLTFKHIACHLWSNGWIQRDSTELYNALWELLRTEGVGPGLISLRDGVSLTLKGLETHVSSFSASPEFWAMLDYGKGKPTVRMYCWQSGCNGKLLEASKRGEQIALRCVACAETYCVNSP